MTFTVVILIILGLALTAGLVYIISKSPSEEKRQPREIFLKNLGEYLQEPLQPLDGKENGFKVKFVFEGVEFEYDDFFQQGFRDKVNKGILKAQANSHLSLSLNEGRNRKTVGTGVLMASEIPDEVDEQKMPVVLPKSLKGFLVNTNSTEDVNMLLSDSKVEKIFAEFKNRGNQGIPYISLKIVEGLLMLEFDSLGGAKPSLKDLYSDIHHLEAYLVKFVVIINKLNSITLGQ